MTEYHAYWDWTSYFLYLLIGIVVLLLVNFAERQAQQENEKKIYPKKSWYAYGSAFILLVFIASTRLVSKSVGGTDAWNYYVGNFQNPVDFHFNLLDILTLNKREPLYDLLVHAVRLFTNNYHIFFIVIYSIISYSLLVYISKNYTKQSFLFICLPFITLYLYSFSAIRWSLCLAFSLLAMCQMQEDKWYHAIGLSIVAFLFHYTGILILGFELYVWGMKNIVEKRFRNEQYYKLFLLICFVLVLLFIPLIRLVVIGTKYDSYLRRVAQGISLWGTLPLILLILVLFLFFKEMKAKDKEHLNFYGVCFNFIITPVVIFCGAYRFDYFFLLARLFMWSYVPSIIASGKYKKFNSHKDKNAILWKKIFYMGVIAGIIVWFTFRLYQMHISNSLMPYINIFWR